MMDRNKMPKYPLVRLWVSFNTYIAYKQGAFTRTAERYIKRSVHGFDVSQNSV